VDFFNYFWDNFGDGEGMAGYGIFMQGEYELSGTEKKHNQKILREQSRRLHDAMMWLVRGFTLYDPRKSYPGFYLSPQQSYVLSVLNEGPITPGEVAKKLRLEKSHLTKIVNTLIGMGAVEKQIDQDDRRRQVLTLTSEGKRIFRELDKVGIDSYMEIMSEIPQEKREKVIEAVKIMLDAVEELRRKSK
jgi:DNA-binding MarR family transcriptional regulator